MRWQCPGCHWRREGKIYGDAALTADYTIDSSVTLGIDGDAAANRTLTAGSGVTLTNYGAININQNDTLTVNGKFINYGTIKNITVVKKRKKVYHVR